MNIFIVNKSYLYNYMVEITNIILLFIVFQQFCQLCYLWKGYHAELVKMFNKLIKCCWNLQKLYNQKMIYFLIYLPIYPNLWYCLISFDFLHSKHSSKAGFVFLLRENLSTTLVKKIGNWVFKRSKEYKVS